MKKIALVLLLLCTEAAFGQSAFVPVPVAFPHIVAGGDPAGTNYLTILQIVNNNSVSITGHISLFGDSGSPLGFLFDGQGPLSTLDVKVDPGQSREIQLTLTGPVTSGWMQISYTPSDALTTVILQFRSGSTLLSEIGVAPAFSPLSETDFAAETNPSLNTGIAIANPSTATAYVLANLWDPNTGALAAQKMLSLPPNGHTAQFLTDLFPTVPNITGIRAEVSLDTCGDSACNLDGPGFFATAVRFSENQFTTIPATEAQNGDQVRILPQVAFGGPPDGLNMKTILYFTTAVQSGVFGTADVFDNDGNPLSTSLDGASPVSSFPFMVPGNRVLRVVLTGDQTLRSGWLRLTLPSSVQLVASAVFQTFSGSTLVSEASVLESPQVQTGLVYVNSQSGLANIGVAFANSQPSSATIALQLFDRTGALVSQQQITLPPNGHLAQFVTELFPGLDTSNGFVGALSMHSTTSFSAIALRLTIDKIATLPIANNGMYRPAITGLRVSSTQRSNGQVNFQIDVTDLDSDLATSSATSVSGFAAVDFGPNGGDSGPITIDGTPLLNKRSGTLTGSFKPPDINGSVPGGTSVVFYVVILDSSGNMSNVVSIPGRY